MVLFGIVSKIEVDHLLHYHIVSSRRLNHLWIQTRHINTESHVCNDLLDDIALLVSISLETDCSEEKAKLVDFTLLMVDEELGDGEVGS